MHTCPKDFVENRNISNILEEAPPLRNKLEFGSPTASGILSPAYWRGGKFNSPGRKPWGKVKIVTEPRAEKEPYLLKDMEIKEVDQVWASDITYIQIEQRNYYLCVVMDWDSRFVLGWSMGRNMDVGLCLKALEMAMSSGRRPRVFNTDQGSQYTSTDWQKAIRAEGIQISMDGKGRWADNIIMERFWRTYKHEFFLHREPRFLDEAMQMTAKWLEYYNRERPHSTLKNRSPLQYREETGTPLAANFWSDFSAPARLAVLRTAPSLRSGRPAYATKSLQKWIDIRGYRVI